MGRNKSTLRVADLVRVVETLAPPSLAEPWDNVGLLWGSRDKALTRVLLAIDFTSEVLAEALSEQCDAVLIYHPPIFEGLKRIPAGTPVYDAIRHDLPLYCVHTALDAAKGGTNDVLADALGLTQLEALRPRRLSSGDVGPSGLGMGRVGVLPEKLSRRALVERVRVALGIDGCLVSGSLDKDVTRVAVCAGAGGEFLNDAMNAKADVYVTGELRHHDAFKAKRRGMTLVCTRHSHSERLALGRLAQALVTELTGVSAHVSVVDREPFEIVGPWLK